MNKHASIVKYYVKRLLIAMHFAQMQKENPSLSLKQNWEEEVKKILKEVDELGDD